MHFATKFAGLWCLSHQILQKEQAECLLKKNHIIAFGSLMEVYCQIQIARDLDYITEEKLTIVRNRVLRISKMLNALRESFQ